MSARDEWFDWQRTHTDALQALQDAQRVYHRAVSGSAFVGNDGVASAATRDALRAVDDARVRLDDVRARQPR